MGLLDKIQAKLDVYRLEQKYVYRKNRATLNTGATYVDGEYVYNNDSNGTLSATSTGSSSSSRISGAVRGSSWMSKK